MLNGRKAVGILFSIGILYVASNLICHANTVSLTWHRHEDTTTTDSTIVSWHTEGTNKLRCDDDGAGSADVACNTTLSKSGETDTAFSYAAGDNVIDNQTEWIACFNAMTRTCCALTSCYGGQTGGYYSGKITIFQSAKKATLVHEVGHKAGLSDINPEITLRIMNYTASDSKNRVITSEKNSYEAL